MCGETAAVTSEVAAGLSGPVVAAAALVAVLLVLVASQAVGALVTVAHEGGHILIGTLTGYRINNFEVKSESAYNGGTEFEREFGSGLANILTTLAGYAAPPLFGLGGAALLAAGEVLVVLWGAVVLLVLAWIKAEKEWTTFLVLLLAVTIGYVAFYGTPVLQAAFAAGLVFVLLLGGLLAAWESSTDDGTDAAYLARDTFIPRIIWKFLFIAVALLSIWAAIRLLAPLSF
ncbi:MAG: hypothetical protein K0R87_3019 [Pseudonocardia sp.]|nr:hypothetical protein [Pseudonocardia sp.]